MKKVRTLLSKDELVYVQKNDTAIKMSIQRILNGHYYLKTKVRECNTLPLSDEQKKEVKKFWDGIGFIHPELFEDGFFDVYNAACEDKSQLKYYIPDSFFYAFVDFYYSNPVRSSSVDDKNLYDLLFNDVKTPEVIARKVDGNFMTKDYEPLSYIELLNILKAQDGFVVKKATSSWGGHGVKFFEGEDWTVEELNAYMYDRNTDNYRGSNPFSQYVIQKCIKQHESLAALNSSSVNTVRVLTLVRNGEVHALSSVLRIGINGSRVDNCSSGGIVVGINEDGTLKGVAYDGNANKYTEHPQSGSFNGKTVPSFFAIVAAAKKQAMKLSGISKMISWDFAVDESGEPVLIEMNINYGELDFHQLCNGPILGSQTKEIVKEVIEHSKEFQEINRMLGEDE